MATGFSEEDKHLLDAFKALGIDPNITTPKELDNWISHYKETTNSRTGATVTVPSQQPRLSIFYGDTDHVNKGEATYEQWRYEVRSLINERIYRDETILQSIRRSVRGEASKILMRLGTSVTIEQVLHKFESVYGIIDCKESLLADFYSAKQAEHESVSTWSCRLEDLLSKPIQKGLISINESNDMLRSMFWTGLRQDLKDISIYKYDTIQDFDALRIELRKIEKEHHKEYNQSTVSKGAVQHIDKAQDIAELKETITNLGKTVAQLSNKLDNVCREVSRAKTSTTHRSNVQHQPHVPDRRNERAQPHYDRQFYAHQQPNRLQRNHPGDGPICYRCGQPGHYQWQCRVRMDHSKNLNMRRPTTRGGR